LAAVNYPPLAQPAPPAIDPKPAVQPPPATVPSTPVVQTAPTTAVPAPAPKPSTLVATAPPAVQPSTPAIASAPAAPAAPAPLPLNPPGAPRLQGIFYSPTSPSAIVDGKIVRVGNQLKDYRVMAISKSMLTLMDQDGKAFQISLGN
jgi:hypothetical protein